MDLTTSCNNSLLFNRTVVAREINQCAATTSANAFHFDQRAGCPVLFHIGRKREHFNRHRRWIRHFFQRNLQNRLIKRFCTFHIIHINFKPTYGIIEHDVTFILIVPIPQKNRESTRPNLFSITIVKLCGFCCLIFATSLSKGNAAQPLYPCI
ncbi:Uncharacterised protein [Vibrio cholerae]|uniref:Uncharacterized protein n=1 Tax=Vibrio cholerae TaxID=666 RepID=A0A656B0A2_VIBCL|nr:Uncharacterised protein [Vibrio cholerae]CSA29700.1 Uncharacterised protein [Vibrio cholerae]CSA47210.1 Uncharacterised protein [Vibrio cholerae]CSA71358.1 Uncharacterised protein [Vibrio cholerae]CSB06945.1 Uncharacterised protein [Vibrio cholerae]